MNRSMVVVLLIGLPLFGIALADVRENARISQQNMRALGAALAIYANDNSGRFPPTPAMLFPAAAPDATMFWHPGDADSAPETINNDISNFPNSARISFDWNLEPAGPYGHFFSDSVLIYDNSPQNNGGAFVSFVTCDGVVETDPPDAIGAPPAPELAMKHLRRLGNALIIYANSNIDDVSGYLPADLLDTWSWAESRPRGIRMFESPRTYWNPGDSDALPDDIDNSTPNGPRSTQTSFDYLTPGVHLNQLTANTVILRDNTPDNNQGFGVFAYFGSGEVRFVAVCAGDTDLDRDVDLTDLATLLSRFGARGAAGPGDIDYDGDVDLEDLARLLAAFGTSCH